MKKLLFFLFFLIIIFSIQVSSQPQRQITLKTGQNATLYITAVNDRLYPIGWMLSYIGDLVPSFPETGILQPYETKTVSFTLSVPENYTGENPSMGYIVVSEKQEGIISSAVLVPIVVNIPDAETKKGGEIVNLAEQIRVSLEKKMENESVIVFPTFLVPSLSPQTYLLLTFPKPHEAQNKFIFLIFSFILTSFALFLIFSEMVKGYGRV